MLIWILTAIGVIGIDQLTKWLAVTYLKPLVSIPCIPYLIDLTYVENRGAAFGIFSDARWIHMSISTIAVIGMIIFMIVAKDKSKFLALSMGMIIGGGVGNLIDRFFVGYVVDFIEPIFIDFAVFNAADSFVCVGAALLFIYVLLYDRLHPKAEKTSVPEEKKSSGGKN